MSSADVFLTIIPQAASFSHVWRTAIMRNIAGVETRSAIFSWPRLKIEHDYINASATKITWLKNQLYNHGASIWGIPCWWDYTRLTAQAASGQPVLAVEDTANRHFYEGRDAIVINGESYEVGVISSIGASSITLDSNLSSTWPAGSYVLPLYDCRIDPVSLSRIFNNVERFSIQATEAYEESRSFEYELPASGAEQDSDGLDIFPFTPSYPVEFSYDFPFDLAQFHGIGYAVSSQDVSNLTLSATFVRKSRAEIYSMLNFFDAQQGRFRKFWLLDEWAVDALDGPVSFAIDEIKINYMAGLRAAQVDLGFNAIIQEAS
jgi:hypothetical protein